MSTNSNLAAPPPATPPLIKNGFGNAIAGFSGGLIATLVLHPLDLVKIRLQVSDAVHARGYSAVPRAAGALTMRGLFSHIVRTEGVRALYRGVAPNALGASLAWGSYFFGYEHLKNALGTYTAGALGPREHMAAALLAGTATLMLTNPVWVVKTRMCLQSGSSATSGPYRSLTGGFLHLFQSEGLQGLYKGFVPGLFGTSHGVVQFVVYEDLKMRLNAWHGQAVGATLVATLAIRVCVAAYNSIVPQSPEEYIAVAASSKMAAAIATYPYQVIRSRLQDQKYGVETPRARDIIRNLWQSAGVRGFYKGLGPNLIRVTPATCITFVVYEYLSKALRQFPALA